MESFFQYPWRSLEDPHRNHSDHVATREIWPVRISFCQNSNDIQESEQLVQSNLINFG